MTLNDFLVAWIAAHGVAIAALIARRVIGKLTGL